MTPAGWYRTQNPAPETCGAEWIILAASGAFVVIVLIIVIVLVAKATR